MLAHRLRLGCQFYAPAALYPSKEFLVLISVRCRVIFKVMMWLEELGKLKKSILIETQIRNLSVCNIAPQPSTLRSMITYS
jgi:hypothetical protein